MRTPVSIDGHRIASHRQFTPTFRSHHHWLGSNLENLFLEKRACVNMDDIRRSLGLGKFLL